MISFKYVHERVYKVLDSCTNRFQYLTATKYLDKLITKLELDQQYMINSFYYAMKAKVRRELNA